MDVSLAELEREITELAGHLNAANYRWLTLIAEFDRRKGWSEGVTHSCAHWLNWKCGIDLGAAREKVRVAHALADLPQISAAMERGALSYSKARALTRVACAATESYLLSIALHGTAQHVETLVRQFRRAREAEELSREARQQAGRGVSWHHDDDGSLVLRARLPAETGALLLAALAAAERAQAGVSAETFAARRADALGAVAEGFLAGGAAALKGGERQQIIVHVDAATLRDRTAGRCEIEQGPAIAAETARRLACDASIVTLIEDDRGEPLDVGRRTRTIPPAIERALRSRDGGCRFPGCTHRRYVDAHHIHHWADGGATKLGNLVTLCRFHHRRLHEGGFRIDILDDGALRFAGPDGRPVEATPACCEGNWRSVVAANGPAGIDAQTATTRWRGERMDYGLAIEVLMAQAARSRPPRTTECGALCPSQ